jgi:hypothetical protein
MFRSAEAQRNTHAGERLFRERNRMGSSGGVAAASATPFYAVMRRAGHSMGLPVAYLPSETRVLGWIALTRAF